MLFLCFFTFFSFFFFSFEGEATLFLSPSNSINWYKRQTAQLALTSGSQSRLFSSPVILQVLSSRSPLENSPQPPNNFLLSFCFFFCILPPFSKYLSTACCGHRGILLEKGPFAINKNSVENKGYIGVFKNSIKNASDNEKGRRK